MLPPPPHGGRQRALRTLMATAALPCLHLLKGLCSKHLVPEGLHSAQDCVRLPTYLTIQGLETPTLCPGGLLI